MAKKRHRSSVSLPWEQGLVASWFSGGVPRVRLALALLALVLTVGLVGARAAGRAKRAETLAAIGMAHEGVLRFRDREGRCPRSLGELLRPPSPGAQYLREEPRDAWGRLLRIRCSGAGRADQIRVVSAGADGSFDDLDNLE